MQTAYNKSPLQISRYRPRASHSSDQLLHNLPIYVRRHRLIPLQPDQRQLICCDLDELCLINNAFISFPFINVLYFQTMTGFEPAILELQLSLFTPLSTSSAIGTPGLEPGT